MGGDATMRFHEVANLFPLLEGKEFEDFKADIATHGPVLHLSTFPVYNAHSGTPGVATRPALPPHRGRTPRGRRARRSPQGSTNVRFSGKVLKAGQVIIPQTTGVVNRCVKAGGFESWEGRFSIPKGTDIGPGDDYKLVLDDGRSADILVLGAVRASGGGDAASFKVNGGWD
jgi:hypothetical protein